MRRGLFACPIKLSAKPLSAHEVIIRVQVLWSVTPYSLACDSESMEGRLFLYLQDRTVPKDDKDGS